MLVLRDCLLRISFDATQKKFYFNSSQLSAFLYPSNTCIRKEILAQQHHKPNTFKTSIYVYIFSSSPIPGGQARLSGGGGRTILANSPMSTSGFP